MCPAGMRNTFWLPAFGRQSDWRCIIRSRIWCNEQWIVDAFVYETGTCFVLVSQESQVLSSIWVCVLIIDELRVKILIHTACSFLTLSSNTIDLGSNRTQWLTVVSSKTNGLCVDSIDDRVPVRFGINVRSGCFIRFVMCLQNVDSTDRNTVYGYTRIFGKIHHSVWSQAQIFIEFILYCGQISSILSQIDELFIELGPVADNNERFWSLFVQYKLGMRWKLESKMTDQFAFTTSWKRDEKRSRNVHMYRIAWSLYPNLCARKWQAGKMRKVRISCAGIIYY